MDTHHLPLTTAPQDVGKAKRYSRFRVEARDGHFWIVAPRRRMVLDRVQAQALADYLNDWLLDTE